jgi:aminoglycoside phosphotransferase (APT) family kinase protein
MYGKRLGQISDEQLQMALDRFHLGTLLHAEPVPFGLFGQNIFLTSTQGAYVLRGSPHYRWQFPTEQFFARLLQERTQVPVSWPYEIDDNEDIFGWSYVLMPRMQGLQLENAEVEGQLSMEDKHAIAHALGENLVQMQELIWPFAGEYHAEAHTVQPFESTNALISPSQIEAMHIKPGVITYREYVLALIRSFLERSRTYNQRTTDADCAWVEMLIARAKDALNDDFQPCFVMRDYKWGNLVVMQSKGKWHVSGLFDLMEGYFGDGEADLSRTTAWYLERDPSLSLSREFIQAYIRQRPPRPGFAERFAVYMLLDRLIIWEFAQRESVNWWDQRLSLQEWAEPYTSLGAILTE